MPAVRTVTRFYLLDLLRAAAALTVVVWHYHHFYEVAPGELPRNFSYQIEPFYEFLNPFYVYGWNAVQLFFVLSGFVFFSQYLASIKSTKVGAWQFFVLRFSRLYPLHFATLIFVALLQFESRSIDGRPLIFLCNDIYHFVLQLFFVSHWGLQQCHSFNAPIWSVSVEILLYCLFFLFARLAPIAGPARFLSVLLAGALGTYLMGFTRGTTQAMGEAILCFYGGGFVYLLLDRLIEAGWRPRNIAYSATLVFGIVSVTIYAIDHYRFFLLYAAGFPAIVMALAALQYDNRELGRRTRTIGDITYSTYLLHTPIQMMILLAGKTQLVTINFSAPGVFLLFLGAVVTLAIPTYHYFEKPVQNYIRLTLGQPSAKALPAR